ncbi:RDD family protein [Nocardia sp. NPDC052566]|uniref:RDD family protein n=1 Tax=Nocardia sp. NPDC052566 TaxID=3364330 RepID=UPI0037C8A7E4
MTFPTEPSDPYAQQQGQWTPPPGYPPAPGNPSAPGYPQGYGAPPALPYAGWGTRVLARLIDAIIVVIPAGILYGIGAVILVQSLDCTREQDPAGYTTETCTTDNFPVAAVILFVLAAIVSLAIRLYLLYREGVTGQTPGKKMFDIRLLRESDGRTVGFGMAIVRELCHIVDSLACYIGWLWPLWDPKRQTFADKIMQTVVIKAG